MFYSSSLQVSHIISVVFIVLFLCLLFTILIRPSLPVSSFASPPSGPSFGSLANQQSAPSFGGLAQQGATFGSQPSSFSGFGQPQQQSTGETSRRKRLPAPQWIHSVWRLTHTSPPSQFASRLNLLFPFGRIYHQCLRRFQPVSLIFTLHFSLPDCLPTTAVCIMLCC